MDDIACLEQPRRVSGKQNVFDKQQLLLLYAHRRVRRDDVVTNVKTVRVQIRLVSRKPTVTAVLRVPPTRQTEKPMYIY